MTEPNFQNRTLYHGDNLNFLRGMNSETIDLIATDPPFNKSRDFHATPDSLAAGSSFQDRWSWRDDIHDDWLIQIQRDNPEAWHVINAAKNVYGDGMGAFICWLGVRLLEMRRVLKPTGSIYLHCDDTASHYIKALMDAIFGAGSYRNEIIWRYKKYQKANMRYFTRNSDRILYYLRSSQATYNPVFEKLKTPKRYLKREWDKATKRIVNAKDEHGRVQYITVDQEKIDDVWELPYLMPAARERIGYPTQKPLALYERIIEASSNPGDIVLDPFCGCATTPIAAERLGRQWVGMDIWDKAYKMVLDRLESEGLAVPYEDDDRYSHLLTFGAVNYTTKPPVRTDDGEEAVLYLQTPTARARRYPPPVPSMRSCCWTLGRSARAAGATTALTPGCWRSTT